MWLAQLMPCIISSVISAGARLSIFSPLTQKNGGITVITGTTNKMSLDCDLCGFHRASTGSVNG